MEELAINGGKPVRETKLYYGHQYIDEADIAAVTQVLRSDYLTCGPKITELENKLCALTGAKYAVVCSNGTAALHMACQAAGVGAGDEVITTPITFAASANCALYVGARPVFADIDEETYNISPASVAEKISAKTRAIVGVDFTGQAIDLDALQEIANSASAQYGRKVYLIEDGAHSIGTRYKGDGVGSIADMTTFSFHPVKTVTGGEGGAVLTNDKALYDKLVLYRSHGITRDASFMEYASEGPWYYEQVALGMNYRMTDIQAALICSQLDKLPMFAARRKEIVKRYNEAFSQMEALVVQKEIEASDTVRHLYLLRIRPEKLSADRAQVFAALGGENICCNVHYIPVYHHPYYRHLGYEGALCPNAEKLYAEMLSLPLHYSLTDQDVEDVIHAVQKVVEKYRV